MIIRKMTLTAAAILLPASLALAQSPPTSTPADQPAATSNPSMSPAPTKMQPAAPMDSTNNAPGAASNNSMSGTTMKKPDTAMKNDTPMKNTAMAPTSDMSTKSVFYDTHADQSDKMLSAYMNHTVYGPNDQNLGSVTDIVADSNGKAVAAIIGVGGFLGIGEKSVAIAFDSLQWKSKDGSNYMSLNVTRDQLKAAPAFSMPKAM